MIRILKIFTCFLKISYKFFYRFNDYNIVEFTTKANALNYDSMDALNKATNKPLIIINESMQFSAGVNLTYTMEFANKDDFKSIEKFIKYFQETC